MGDWEIMMIRGGGEWIKSFSSGRGPYCGCIYYDKGYVDGHYVMPVQVFTTEPIYKTTKEAVAAMDLLVKNIREIENVVQDTPERSNE